MPSKRLLQLVLVFVVPLLFVFGCEKDSLNGNEQVEVNKESPADRFEFAYDILKKEKDTGEYQGVSIQHLNRNYMLIEMRSDDKHYPHGGTFYLFDVEKEEMTELFREGYPEIKEITRDSITFILQSHNGPAEQGFPYLLNVDFETGETKEKPYYASLDKTIEVGAGQPVLNGAGFMLEGMETTDNTIIFRIGETEDIFIAGGMVSPKIELSSCFRLHRKFGTEKVLGITLEDTLLKNNLLKENLKEHPKVKDAHVEEYSDGLDVDHVLVVMEFNNEIQYNCAFEKDEDELVSDLYISLK